VTKSENIILLNTCSKGEVEDWGDEKPVEKSIGEAIGQNIKRLLKAKVVETTQICWKCGDLPRLHLDILLVVTGRPYSFADFFNSLISCLPS